MILKDKPQLYMPLIGSLEILSSSATGTATNLGPQTQHGIAIGEGLGVPLNWVVLSSGQLLVGNTGADPTPSNLVAGTGITITNVPGTAGNPGTITITSSGGGTSYPWIAVSGPVGLSPNAGYVVTGNGAVLTMPLAGTGVFGNITEIVGDGFMWTLLTNGNTIHFITQTAGPSGSLASTTNYDAVAMLCVGPSTYVVKSSEGNITVNP
jgi:hypothetical protein